MKRFAILFAALCMVGIVTSESSAQCSGGGGYYGRGVSYGGGGYYRGGGYNNFGNVYRSNVYRPSVGISYGYARPVYRNYGYSRPYYGGSYYRGGGGGCGYGRGISIRF